MGTVDLDKLKEQFVSANREMVAIEQRFEQLTQLAKQIETEQSQLRLKAQYLVGQLEMLKQVLPEDIQEDLIQQLRTELEQAQQNAQQAASGPIPVNEESPSTEE